MVQTVDDRRVGTRVTATHHLLLSSRYCIAVTNPRFNPQVQWQQGLSSKQLKPRPGYPRGNRAVLFWLLGSGLEGCGVRPLLETVGGLAWRARRLGRICVSVSDRRSFEECSKCHRRGRPNHEKQNIYTLRLTSLTSPAHFRHCFVLSIHLKMLYLDSDFIYSAVIPRTKAAVAVHLKSEATDVPPILRIAYEP